MRQNNGRHISWCKGIFKVFQLVSKKFLIGVKMKKDIKLSTGRIVSHRPYLSNGLPNGATEAFIKYEQDLTLNDVFYSVNYAMTHDEWVEYCNITKV